MSGSAANAGGPPSGGGGGRAGRPSRAREASHVGGRAWAGPRPAGPLRRGSAALLKKIVPDAGRRNAEPVIAVFASLLHGNGQRWRHDAVEIDLLGGRQCRQIDLGEIGPHIHFVLSLAYADE